MIFGLFQEFFVYDATEDQLFITVNHMKNLSNLYTSDVTEWKFALSLKRILYHNPDTDISTKWLRYLQILGLFG